MGTLQQSFNQALTGATFLLQQTPLYTERREAYSLNKKIKSWNATEEELKKAANPRLGASKIELRNSNLAGMKLRAIEKMREEQERLERQKKEQNYYIDILKGMGIPDNVIAKARFK